MTLIANAYRNAFLADATYALKRDGIDGLKGDDLAGLLSERMTPTLAKSIGDKFTVVSHIESNDVVGSGFDATVWRENASGKLYVSMQGTEGLQDFITDRNLALTGNARDQIADMVNCWARG
jgi:hypothetical protein